MASYTSASSRPYMSVPSVGAPVGASSARPAVRSSLVDQGHRPRPAGARSGDPYREARDPEPVRGGQPVEAGEPLDLAVLPVPPDEVSGPQDRPVTRGPVAGDDVAERR